MLTSDDATVAADAGLPGLRFALDEDAVAAAVAAAVPHLDVTAAVASYVRFKPSTSAVVAYRFSCRDGHVDGYLRTHAHSRDDKLAKAVDWARERADGDRASAMLLDPHTAVLFHPFDADLPALYKLAEPVARDRVIGRVMGVDGRRWTVGSLRYNPERRWVGRLSDDADFTGVVKVQRLEDHRRAVAGARAFATAGAPAAGLVASSERYRIAVHEWVPGVTAAALVSAPAGPAVVDAVGHVVGALVAEVHARPVVSGVGPAANEAEAVGAAVDAVAALSGPAGVRAARVAGSLELSAVGPRAMLHGDCSVDQVVVDGNRAALIDLDRACAGDPLSDLAQVVADLRLRQITGEITDAGPVADAVLHGYEAAGGVIDGARLGSLTAARLLRLAPDSFRRRRPDWLHDLDEVIGCADRERTGR